jgi:hypothetical protein
MSDPASLHHDLVSWGVLEPDAPVRFTRRFQGALARAAGALQTVEKAGQGRGDDVVGHQVDTALATFLGKEGGKVEAGHRAFARAVQLSSLPEGVRRILGYSPSGE